MVIHGAPAGALAVGAHGGVVAPLPRAEAPLEKPSAFVTAYVEHLKAGHAKGSWTNIESNLRRIIRDLGDRWAEGLDGVGAWIQTARQVNGAPMEDTTRDKIRTYLNGWIGWALSAGAPWNRMPLLPLKKKKETVRQKQERGGVHDDLTEPLTLDQLRAVLALTDDRTNWLPDYMRVGVQMCAMTGLSGVDVDRLMREGGAFEQRGDHLWLGDARQKSAVAFEVPLAPWLAERLRPYFDPEEGFRVPQAAVLKSWDWHWVKIEEAVGIPHLDRQGIKRLRVTFNTLIENEIGAPVAVAKALLGHRIKGRDAHGAYTKPTPEQLIKAVAAFQAKVFPPG